MAGPAAPAPYTVELDADTARELAGRGATLLLLGVPPGTALGLDQQTFLVGPRFQGVKMIPPGTHAVSYAAGGARGGEFGATTAFFVALRGGQVLVKRWNAGEETLEDLGDSDEVRG